MPNPKNQPVLSHYVSVLQVSNIQRSILFYTLRLGFEVTFEWGDPTDYVIIKRDTIKIHLSENKKLDTSSTTSRAIYIFTTEIDQHYANLKAKGIENISPPQEADYGMVDFDVTDPDGNLLTFGSGVKNKS